VTKATLCIVAIFAIHSVYGASTDSKIAVPEKTTSGLQFFIQSSKKGRPALPGNFVVYSAVGSLIDGRVFLDTRGRSRLHTVGSRTEDIPVGLQEGLELLRAGDRATITVPAQLGYGVEGETSLQVPPNATLQFEVEIIEIDAGKLSNVMKKAMDEGGIKRAETVLRGLRDNKFADVYVAEGQLNYLDYVYLSRHDKAQDAATIFEWNTELYPNAPNTWDSLADAYLLDEKFDLALSAYQKALALDPLGRNQNRWQDRIKRLDLKPVGISRLELMRLRMRMSQGGFADESFVSNLPMSVSILRQKLDEYIAAAPPIEADDAATLVTQFFEVLERNRPDLLENAITDFSSSNVVSVRRAAELKRLSLQKP